MIDNRCKFKNEDKKPFENLLQIILQVKKEKG